jgi:hypothetical protein
MEGSAGADRYWAWALQHFDEVGGDGSDGPPYDRSGVKYSQAVISQTADGKWKMFIQSDRQVETMLIGSLEDIIKELKFAATREWHQRS